MAKRLTIRHDGKLVLSGFGTLRLGEKDLHAVFVEAFSMDPSEYKEVFADVIISIRIKDDAPQVKWEDDQC